MVDHSVPIEQLHAYCADFHTPLPPSDEGGGPTRVGPEGEKNTLFPSQPVRLTAPSSEGAKWHGAIGKLTTQQATTQTAPVGRFAPTPSGRMHLGNVFAAMVAWLSVRSRGGSLVLRMEDLDTQRTSEEYACLLRDDLAWLGLDWDIETPPQSARSQVYDRYFEKLQDLGLLYPCYCTRSQLHNINAPHQSDGTYVYSGACRDLTDAQRAQFSRLPAWRVKVPDQTYRLTDLAQGEYAQDLLRQCGDFVVRRADGVYVYQLAVTVDDGESGVTEVVRGVDLLGSAPRQMYLQSLFGFQTPSYGHVPMLLSSDGRRLSKRDRDLDMGTLRQHCSGPQILGTLAYAAGIIDKNQHISARELAGEFTWDKLRKTDICLDVGQFAQI